MPENDNNIIRMHNLLDDEEIFEFASFDMDDDDDELLEIEADNILDRVANIRYNSATIRGQRGDVGLRGYSGSPQGLRPLQHDVEDMDYVSQRREMERLNEELMNLQRMIDEREGTKIERTGVKL